MSQTTLTTIKCDECDKQIIEPLDLRQKKFAENEWHLTLKATRNPDETGAAYYRGTGDGPLRGKTLEFCNARCLMAWMQGRMR